MTNSSRKLFNVGSRQLLAFLEISRLHSFARAAEQVALSPSGMSMLVRELEDHLGVRLFDRTTRSVTLTDAGRRLQPAAERIVAELRSLEPVLAGAEAAVRSRLDIAATPMVSASLLPVVIREFARSHPQVRVQLVDVDVDAVRRTVLGDEANIGLGFFFKPAAGLLRQPLCKFRLMRISPRGDGAAGLGPPRPWRSLSGSPLIGLPADNPIQALIEAHLARIGRAHEERPAVNLIGTLIAMVEAGLGHAVVPSFVLGECLRRELAVALLVEPAVHIDLYLVSRRGAQATAAALEFAAAVRRAASKMAA